MKFIAIILIIYFVILGILNMRVYNVPKFKTFEEQLEYAKNLLSEKREQEPFLKYYLDLGWKRPLIAYKRVVEWYPEESGANIGVYGPLGGCYTRVKDFKKALEYYNKNIEILKKIKPDDYFDRLESMYDVIADLFILQRKYNEAIELYKNAMSEFPPDSLKDRQFSRYHFTYQIANIYSTRIKDKAKADEWYKKAAEIRPY